MMSAPEVFGGPSLSRSGPLPPFPSDLDEEAVFGIMRICVWYQMLSSNPASGNCSMPRSNAAARRIVLRRLLGEPVARTQEQLAARLADEGHPVTQATVSRDLAAIGAVRAKSASGKILYESPPTGMAEADPGTRILRRRLQSFVTGLEGSLNLTVVRTQPSTAPSVAAALDAASLDGVLGTVAGDDTVLIVTRGPDGGSALAHRLGQILKG